MDKDEYIIPGDAQKALIESCLNEYVSLIEKPAQNKIICCCSDNLYYINKPMNTIGRSRYKVVYLIPEEVLYLSYKLIIYRDKQLVPIKNVFHSILSNHLRLENFIVFSYLKRAGFIVTRFGWTFKRVQEEDIELDSRAHSDLLDEIIKQNSVIPKNQKTNAKLVDRSLTQKAPFVNETKTLKSIKLEKFDSYSLNQDCSSSSDFQNVCKVEAFKSENYKLIPNEVLYTNCCPFTIPIQNSFNSFSPKHDSQGLFIYDVWKPSSKFKKTQPGFPHFRVLVNTFSDTFPTIRELLQLSKLFNNDGVELKVAVVDQGVVSFMSIDF